ncbi:MAG: hypothetical protein RL648_375 [Verrucomicrobiota bacterium]|jgi:transglutaminase-like putative cysteine protease
MDLLKQFGQRELAFAVILIAFACGIAFYKVNALGYQIVEIQPEPGYQVTLEVAVEAADKAVRVSTFLPAQSPRQRIRRESQTAPSFEFTVSPDRQAVWESDGVKGPTVIRYEFFAQTEKQTFALPSGLLVNPSPNPSLVQFLGQTDTIQAEDEDIIALAWELMPNGATSSAALRAVFDYVADEIEYRPIRGATDAVTALKLQQASCNGKNRLFIALCRARGIPARFVKGLILENASKRTTHAWSEVYLGNEWIPFCPTNGYFAEIPAKYLELAKTDRALFIRTSSIGFDWTFTVEPKVTEFAEAIRANADNPLNFLNHWVSLEKNSVSIHLIMVVLLIPIAATVVAIARTLVGLHTFGTFMPSLIAVSFLLTGYWTGSLFFMSIMLITGLMNLVLLRLHLLHLPRLVIILTIVVILIMLTSILATRLEIPGAAGISLFPIAILSLTSERLSQTIEEDGYLEAIKRVLITYLVSAACYALISNQSLQLLIAAFPELLLVNIAANLAIGSWHGIRLSEYIRFNLLFRPMEQ